MTATASELRTILRQLMQQTVDDQRKFHNWHYLAVRPQTIPATYDSSTSVVVDCSSGVRTICRVAGVPDDPAGNSYAPYGNSSSIWAHLPHGAIAKAEPGDIFTFGTFGEHHACMAFTSGSNPTVWNMGTQGQPIFNGLDGEIAGHKGMAVTLCKLNLPTSGPSPKVEHLLTQTGFYSWVAWRQGEGLWKPYGRANAKVRPNVPKVIPPVWWAHYSRFLANRKKPNR